MAKLRAMGMLVGCSAAIVAASFASCSNERNSKSETPKPQIIIPTSPGSGTSGDGLNTSSKGLLPILSGIDGTWNFVGFECTKGTLTPWAKLENKLVSAAGLETGSFQWNTGGQDDGYVKRRHIWKIAGDQATRESFLEFHSTDNSQVVSRERLPKFSQDTMAPHSATAWASTKKQYRISRIATGRLVLQHGEIDGPFFQGLPLDPIYKILENQVGRMSERAEPGSALLKAVQNIQRFLQRTFSGEWVGSTMDFVNEVTQATESVNYTFDQSTMTFSNATVSIRGFTGEPGIKLVDVTACGVGGQAVRKYQREVVPLKK